MVALNHVVMKVLNLRRIYAVTVLSMRNNLERDAVRRRRKPRIVSPRKLGYG